MTFTDFLKTKHSTGLNKGQLSFFYNFLSHNRNIFLTSEAGCGKSFVINRFTEFCKDNNILLSKTASTGTAAINISAQTLHSFLGIGTGDDDVSILIKKINKNKLAKKRLHDCKIILIEECSMVSGELFQKVYDIFRYFKNKLPRFIVVGDFLQISPVFISDSQYAFESSAWNDLDFVPVVLNEIVRQDSQSNYAKILSRVRVGDKSCSDFIYSRIVTDSEIPESVVMVYSKNIDVDHYNNSKLKLINSKLEVFESSDSGSDYYLGQLNRNCIAPKVLELKIGAQVMCLRNIQGTNIVNGSIGKVHKINESSVDVKFSDGITNLQKETWSIEESVILDGKVKTKVLASRKQIPLKLSWASTIHKVQGATLDNVCLNLEHCFGTGMCYTALSRAKSESGLFIKNFNPSSIKVSSKCLDFYSKLL